MHSLVEAAKRSGISAVYEGIDGAVTEVPEETLRRILAALGPDDPASDDGARPQLPPDARCHLPDFLEEKRAWAIQQADAEYIGHLAVIDRLSMAGARSRWLAMDESKRAWVREDFEFCKGLTAVIVGMLAESQERTTVEAA